MDWGDLERGRPSNKNDDRGGDSYRGIPYASIVACAVRENTIEIFAEELLHPLRSAFAYGSASEATSAAEQIKDRVRDVAREQNRPRRLLLVVNPVAGDGRWVSSSTDVRSLVAPRLSHSRYALRSFARSRQLVDKFLRPFFEKLAGAQLTVIETKEGFREDGLRERLRLEEFDGALAVGGDGVFGYLCQAVLDVHQSFPDDLHLAHIAAGSTDAVASTIASRNPFASSVCVALGKRMRMDYLEVSAVGGEVVATTKPAVCICTAGFMADIIGMSESSRYRPFGPFRNDVAGFLALLRNRAHAYDIKYKESPSAHGGGLAQADDCTGASCPHCAAATTNATTTTTAAATGWKVLRGDFLSVMILNTACKSDKTPCGMNHRVHLGDGSAYLVWVLISTEVCSLFARPDSFTRASRFARSPDA